MTHARGTFELDALPTSGIPSLSSRICDLKAYPTIRHALNCFSIQLGMEREDAENVLFFSLASPEYRARTEDELRCLVQDPHVPWMELVQNDEYELDSPESHECARIVVLGHLWHIVFGLAPPEI